MKPVTHSDIAAASDVSRSTVTRVLQNHPNVSSAVRTKVLEAAKAMGYRPNPAMGVLASFRWPGGKTVLPPIAFLNNRYRPAHTYAQPKYHFNLEIKKSIWKRADSLGYQIEELYLREQKPGTDLSGMLYARGVQGIIMDIPKDEHPLVLDKKLFSIIVISDEKRDLEVNMVTSNWALIFETAVREVLKKRMKGKGKIGFVILDVHDRDTNLAMSAQALLQQKLLQQDHQREVALYFSTRRNFDGKSFEEWRAKEDPSVLICSHNKVYFHLLAQGVNMPRDLSYVSLMRGYAPNEQRISSVDRQAEDIGIYAVDFLHQLLSNHQVNFNSCPVHHLVSCKWFPGKTL